MNTNLIKTFATKARSSLLISVENRLKYWGINPDGNHGDAPQTSGAGYIYTGKVVDDPTDVPKLWRELAERVRTKEQYQDLIEEAAYTWFNRIMIIKIMEQNDLLPKILAYTSGTNIPTIIAQAKNGSYSLSRSSTQKVLANYLMNNEDEKALGLIIKDLFESNKILQSIFGMTPKLFNLLLPPDLLKTNGLIYKINVESGFDKAMYKEVELIGWIYQFYISDKKAEVFKGFKKNKKARAKDIPAATQIFTPKWIVKYMVENTVGKIYLDYNPESELRSEMKYLVKSDQANNLTPKKLIADIKELTLIDPASGSGHILVKGFDLLMKIYKEEGYSTKQATRSILENNLYGLDIDDRAIQLSRFALLLKASQYDASILSTNNLIFNVYAFPESKVFYKQDLYEFLGDATELDKESFTQAIELLSQGKNVGSALRINLSQSLITTLQSQYVKWDSNPSPNIQKQVLWKSLSSYVDILLMLCKKYEAVVANPPYMGNGNMNESLKRYVSVNYPNSKSDLCTVFIEAFPFLSKNKFGFIVPPSWMFLSSFEQMRLDILNNFSIDSALLLSRGIFGADFGSACSIFSVRKRQNSFGSFFRIVERTFQEIHYMHLESLFLKALNDHTFKYNFKKYNSDSFSPDNDDKGQKINYPHILQEDLFRIPKSRFGFWASKAMLETFDNSGELSELAFSDGKNVTGNNSRFLRFLWEPSKKEIGRASKWMLMTKGGAFRRYYGNLMNLMDWSQKARAHYRSSSSGRLIPEYLWFKKGITWSKIASKGASFRLLREDSTFDEVNIVFYDDSNLELTLAFLNSKVPESIFKILNPTFSLQTENILEIPISKELLKKKDSFDIDILLSISRNDWDAKEISWDFLKSPLLNRESSLSSSYNVWLANAKIDFFQLHAKEEELNQRFIEIYGLHEELTSHVLLKDISILQDEIDRKALEKLEPEFRKKGQNDIELPINVSIVMSQLISYCMGISMGRYRLDKGGLQIAHQDSSEQELANYIYNGYEIEIDDDAIIPLLGDEGNFSDDALLRTKHIILAIWGEESHTDNINFLHQCLGMSLHKWLTEKFWIYHSKTMYKKKPIYWLFCSNPKKPQNAAFRVLTYMHRMDKYTVQNIRTKYLHPHQEYIQSQISDLQVNEVSLSKEEARKLDLLREQQIECMDYDDKLKSFANQQITFDLDDGVTENYKLFKGVVAEIN